MGERKISKKNTAGWVRLVACLLAVLLIQACAGPSTHSTAPPTKPGQPKPYRVMGTWYQPMEHARDFAEEGMASWYGEDFHGRKTSNGEIYDMYGMTAAHKTLPLGTYVRVRNTTNNRHVDVRVNDRGPFVRGRIIDLTYTAAKQIDILGPGTAPVQIEALGALDPTTKDASAPRYIPMDYYSGDFTFQIGAFTEKANAQRLVQKLSAQYPNTHMAPFFDGRRTFYRVRVGRSTTLEQAEQFEQSLKIKGFADTFIVAE
jgi:rare lipoprotein A